MHIHRRRVLAAILLLLGPSVAVAGSLAVRRFPARTLSANRSGYQRFLLSHGAAIVGSDSAALQQTLNDCGIAVVREALRSLGVAAIPSHDSVARLAGLTAEGTTLSELSRVTQLAGAHTTFTNHLVLGSHLFVAHLSIGHFVLVREISNERVRFFDPMVGEVVASSAVFESLWSGHGFAVTAKEVSSANASPSRSALGRNGDFSLRSMERSP